jgi:DNA-binding transcriptional LysR family regulator
MKLANADLRLFSAIADQGGVSAAARYLGVQKSTVSRDLALLEERLGHRLIERTTRSMRLTEAGNLLLAYAHRVTEELEAAEAAMEALSSEPMGELRVSVPHAFAERVLVPLLPDFRARYPKITIGLDLSPRLVDLVEEGIDVAIRFGELQPSSLVARRLGAIPVILIASPGYLEKHGTPHSAADLAHHAVIGLGTKAGPTTWRLETPAGAETVGVHPVVGVADVSLIRRMALSDLGIAPVPSTYVRDELANGRLVHVLPGTTRGRPPVHAVYPSRRVLAPKVRVFIDAVAEAMREYKVGES